MDQQQPQQNALQPAVFKMPDLSHFDPQQREIAVAVANKLVGLISTAALNYPTIKTSCDRAAMALSRITGVTNADEDKVANDTLVKVRTTFEQRQAERMEITRELDDMKAFFMEPEKQISTDKKSGSLYAKVSGYRDTYAAAEKKRIEDEKARLKLEQDKANERARITAELNKNAVNGMAHAVALVSQWCSVQWAQLTLDNIEEFKGKLESVPILKPETYNGWFGVTYRGDLVTIDEYKAAVDAAVAAHPYAAQNTSFSSAAQEAMKPWLAQIDTKRADLLRLAQLARENAAAAAAEKKRQDDAAAELAAKQQQELDAKQQAHNEAIDQQLASAQMTNAFTAQIGEQSVGEQSNTKTAKIGRLNCAEEEIVNVVSQVIYYVFTHPQYKGFYERDGKTKEYKRDELGRPVYAKWLADLLNFFATNCDPLLVDGVAIEEKTTAVNKA